MAKDTLDFVYIVRYTDMVPQTRIEMLGGLRVLQQGKQIERFQTRKTGELLAYLALHSDRTHSRDSVAKLLWGEEEVTLLRNRLNQAVSSLRRQLHPPTASNDAIVIATHQLLSIRRSAVKTDVEEFIDLIQKATAAQDEKSRFQNFLKAIQLYSGEFLEGFNDVWIGVERARLHHLFLEAVGWCAKYAAKNDLPEKAIELVLRKLQLEAFNEQTHRILLRLYLSTNRNQSARLHSDELIEYARRNQKELEPKTMELIQTIARSPVQIGPVPDHAVVTVAESPQETLQQTIKSNIPLARTKFFGRENELLTLETWYAEQSSRLLTILGLGGSGKTRLATEFSRHIQNRSRGNTFFVSFESWDAQSSVALTILESIQQHHSQAAIHPEDLYLVLQTANEVLLVLDNLEVMQPIDLLQIGEIMNACPGVKVLSTSRRQLGLYGEQLLQLEPLPAPSEVAMSEADITILLQNPTVAMFTDRAQLVRHDFQLTKRTYKSIVELCFHLEGIPLAIELAAAWMRTMTVGQVLEQLRSSPLSIQSRRGDSPERHFSLERAIEGSYILLTPEQQEVLMRIAVFSGKFTIEDAQAVCPEFDVLVSLNSLAHLSLVRVNADETVQYSMFEMVRAFVEGRTAPLLRQETEQLYAERCVALVESISLLEYEQTYRIIHPRLHHFVWSERWLVSNGEVSRAIILTLRLARYYASLDMFSEAIAVLEHLSQARHAEIFERAQFDLTLGLIHCYRQNSKAEEAMQLIQSLDEGIIENLSSTDRVLLEFETASTYIAIGRLEEVIPKLHNVQSLAQQLGFFEHAVRAVIKIGQFHLAQNDHARATDVFENGLKMLEDQEEVMLEAFLHFYIAEIYLIDGKFELAQKLLESARNVFESYYNHKYAIWMQSLIAECQLERGNLNGALESLLKNAKKFAYCETNVCMFAFVLAKWYGHQQLVMDAQTIGYWLEQRLSNSNLSSVVRIQENVTKMLDRIGHSADAKEHSKHFKLKDLADLVQQLATDRQLAHH